MKRKLIGALVVMGVVGLPTLLLAEARTIRYYTYRNQPKVTTYNHAPARPAATTITYESSNPGVVRRSYSIYTSSRPRTRSYSVVRYSYHYRPRYRYYYYYPRVYWRRHRPRYRYYWSSYGWWPSYCYGYYGYPWSYSRWHWPRRGVSIRYRSRRPHWRVSIGWSW